ncbi:MAG: ComF family protein [Spirochaetota bacterium]
MRNPILTLLNFILPLSCSLCNKQDLLAKKIGICRECYEMPKEVQQKECPICKSVIESSCDYCNSRNVFFDELIYLRKGDTFHKKILRKIKFSKEPHLSYVFRWAMFRKLASWKKISFQSIFYLTSNRKTLLKRPFHPCTPILSRLAEYFQAPLASPVKKVSTELQSSKTYQERFLHAKSAFELYPEFRNQLTGNYLLVDDVFTTGATLNEVARILKENGASAVYVLVMLKGESR